MKFSLIVPLYNKSATIAQCIQSVNEQDFDSWELIIVDDGSTDSPEQLIQPYLSEKIFYFRKENGGVSSARNKGIELAQGDYVCFLDADDLISKDYFSTFSKFLTQLDWPDAICASYFIESPAGFRRNKLGKGLHSIGQHLFEIKDFFLAYSTGDPPLTSNSVAIHRNWLINSDLRFDTSVKNGEDTLLWMDIFLHTKIFLIDFPTSTYFHSAPNRSDHLNNLREELPVIRLLEKRFQNQANLVNMASSFKTFIARHLMVTLRARILLKDYKGAILMLKDERIWSYKPVWKLAAAFLFAKVKLLLSRQVA